MSGPLPDDGLLDLCHRVLEMAAGSGSGSDEAMATVARRRGGLTRFANSTIHQNVGEEVVSVGLLLARGGRVARGRTTQATDEGLDRLVSSTAAAAAIAPFDPDWPGVAGPGSAIGATYDPATDAVPPADRAAMVASFCAAGPTLRAAGFAETEALGQAVATTGGAALSGASTRATVDGIHQTPTSAGKGHATSASVSGVDAAAVGAAAAALARASQEPGDLEPGRYPVVLGPECVATIAEFLGFYGFNAKLHLEGQSFVELGSAQFDVAFTLHDDATDMRALGVPFDAEGTPKRRLDLVADGRSQALAYDRRVAKRAGAESTGHAVDEGETWGPMPLNLFVGEGDRSAEDLVADLDRGLLVTQFNYCRVLDPKTLVVTGLTRNGTFWVERGEIRRAVSNLRFTQSFPGALAPGQVRGRGFRGPVRGSLSLGTGIVVAPTLALAEWNFTGGARG